MIVSSSNLSGIYRLYEKPKENWKVFQKFLRVFCIFIGYKEVSRNFISNHSFGRGLRQLNELSRNFRIDKPLRYFVYLFCAQEAPVKAESYC